MSVQPVNLLLGQGELFFKKDTDASGKYMRVGNLKGEVTFSYEFDTAEQKPGNRLTIAKRVKIAERATLSGSIADFKVAQLIAVLGLSISVTQLTVTGTLRAFEEIAFGSTTTTRTLGNTAVSMTSIVVTKMDNSTKYVMGTHFSAPSVNGVKPITTTFANKSQLVSYDTADTGAKQLRVGDKTTLQVVDLKFTHRQSDGKFITIEIPRATITNGISIPFSDESFSMYNVTFAALGDTTAASGKSLFNIIREA